jgi:glycosyltransferase involved in cell wall biosynthesis
MYDAFEYPKYAVEGLQVVDYVTTTTEHFADKIREYNKNVIVLPNSIDATTSQFIPKPVDSDRVRIGWIGGVFHQEDLKLVSNGFKEVWKTIKHDKFQFALGGWNCPEKLDYVKKQLASKQLPNEVRSLFKTLETALILGQDVQYSDIFRKELGNIPPYDLIEGYFTDFLKYPKDSGYKEYLQLRTAQGNELGDNKPYRRILSATATEYARMYNEIDVALVPLKENNFNGYKSQIKIIEAGYFKKAVIVSNVAPYTFDCTNKNSILISPSKRGDGWGSAMKSLIINPNKREDLAEALHEHVMDNYMMDKTNELRHQLYQSL